MSEEKYRFFVEWYDPNLKIKRKFLFGFYPSDCSVEMYDTMSKKLFLRRVRCETVNISDLFIGSVVNVLSRQLLITDFGDSKTARKFSEEVELTLLVINSSGYPFLGKIISILEKNDLSIYRGKMIDKDKFSCSLLFDCLETHFLILEVKGANAVHMVRKLVYPEMPIQRPLRVQLAELAQYCVAPKDNDIAHKELDLFFPVSKEVHCNSAIFENSTCCIVKPHALREKLAGMIIQDILDAGFIISALEIVSFNMLNASEFLEVYKGVVSEYKDMVAQLISGPCIAMEISGSGELSVHKAFRTFVGPMDAEIARKLRPGTLRAKYGFDKVKNAVHCTDLSEDSEFELEYVFKVLAA